MKSYLLFAYSLILLTCCNNADNKIIEPPFTRVQIILKRTQYENDSLLQLISNKGYQEYYSRSLFYLKYHYFKCDCSDSDDKIHSMNNAKFILSKLIEKGDTIWGKVDSIVRLDFNIMVNDSIRCFRLIKEADIFETSTILGLSFSKKDTTLLAIHYNNNVTIPVIPNMRIMILSSFDRLENFKFNRQYADDTLNYLFEKYKNDSIIYY